MFLILDVISALEGTLQDLFFLLPFAWRLHIKFTWNWPNSFRGEALWKCWRQMEDRGYHPISPPRALGSGEQKTLWNLLPWFCFLRWPQIHINQTSWKVQKYHTYKFSQLSISQSESSAQTTTISKENFWSQKIYFEISVVWDKRNWKENKDKICVHTILFDMRGYFEILVFVILRVNCTSLYYHTCFYLFCNLAHFCDLSGLQIAIIYHKMAEYSNL